MNTNNFSALAKNLSQIGSTVLQSRLAPLANFSTVIKILAPDAPGLDAITALASAPAATQITGLNAAADFESSADTLSPLSFAVKLFTQPFGLTNAEIQGGGQLRWLAETNARQLAESLSDAVFALLTTANYGQPVVTVSATQFGLSNFETLCAAVPSEARAVVLDSPLFVKVKPATWEPRNTTTYEASKWSAAATNVAGFVADRRAVVIQCGLPSVAKTSRTVIHRELLELPQLPGLVAEAAVWTSLQTRSIRAAYSLLFAPAVGDPAALKLLTSA
jgi:hypothetical protein